MQCIVLQELMGVASKDTLWIRLSKQYVYCLGSHTFMKIEVVNFIHGGLWWWTICNHVIESENNIIKTGTFMFSKE